MRQDKSNRLGRIKTNLHDRYRLSTHNDRFIWYFITLRY